MAAGGFVSCAGYSLIQSVSPLARPYAHAQVRYLVLPARPAGTEGWEEERLRGTVTRDCMIGVAVPRPDPAAA